MATSITPTAINFSDGTSLSHSTKPYGSAMRFSEISTSTNRTASTSMTDHLQLIVNLSKTQDILIECYFAPIYQSGSTEAQARILVDGAVISSQSLGTNQDSNKLQGPHHIISKASNLSAGNRTITVQVSATGGTNTIFNYYGYSDYLKVTYI